jgi:hypothetical protein
VPLRDMARAMSSWVKSIALLCFGWAYVPEVPFEEAFFRGHARAVLAAVGQSVPVVLIGGVTIVDTM